MTKKEKLSISLDKELVKWLREKAEAENRNLSNMIEQYLLAAKNK